MTFDFFNSQNCIYFITIHCVHNYVAIATSCTYVYAEKIACSLSAFNNYNNRILWSEWLSFDFCFHVYLFSYVLASAKITCSRMNNAPTSFINCLSILFKSL